MSQVSPTAMGLRSPAFFDSVVRLAEAKTGRTNSGALPASIRLTKSPNVFKRTFPASVAAEDSESLRCCGRRPLGPPAEPVAKLCTALSTREPEISNGCSCVTGKACLSGCSGGCFSSSSFMFSSLGRTTPLSEDAILTAALMWPSLICSQISFESLSLSGMTLLRGLGFDSTGRTAASLRNTSICRFTKVPGWFSLLIRHEQGLSAIGGQW